jgi:hypothetical protein
MNSTQTLLVYDDAVETSEVLKAVYQPRGLSVQRVTSRTMAQTGSSPETSLMVVNSGSFYRMPGRESRLSVVIGRLDVDDDSLQTAAAGDGERTCRLPSLFDYRELVSAIDRLLCVSD